ncbi:MAG: hypothetical protein LBF12_07395, partial [Christensenellaceae bacterium]|nr:hypothetical protein [Christensenellaceae bacterium]
MQTIFLTPPHHKNRFYKKLKFIESFIDFKLIADKIDSVILDGKDLSLGGRPRYATKKMIKILFMKWYKN